VLHDGLLLFYCAAIGFVAAGIAASFFRMVTSQPARFALLGQSWFGLATTFVFCALTGPAIIMDQAIRSRSASPSGLRLLLVGTLVAALWSICTGILVLQLVVAFGRPAA
jgi:hypothetical protein